MLHPVGSHRPAVYWRRRVTLLVVVVVLVVLSALVLHSGGGGDSPASASTGAQSSAAAPVTGSPDAASTPAGPATSTGTHSRSATPAAPAGSGAAHSTAAVTACTATQLKVAAVVGKSTYQVGSDPVVMLQVTNSGPAPCVQNLADSQIQLMVYNGESRVWGSHDCEIQPGTDNRTLPVGQAVRVSVTWSGLSSQPKCAGTRQRVGAGSYTLYASLSGHQGTAAQFSIS